MTLDATAVASAWLEGFEAWVNNGGPENETWPFLKERTAWWRDSLVFDNNLYSLRGDEIKAFVAKHKLADAKMKATLSTGDSVTFPPSIGPMLAKGLPQGVSASFTFTTQNPPARCRAFVRLLEENGTWKAYTLYTEVDEIIGFEEKKGNEHVQYHGTGKHYGEVFAEEGDFEKNPPTVLVVGAGQSGVIAGATFRQHNIRTLIIERKARVGDNWRERYPNLMLHTSKNYNTLPYLPFPSSWSSILPRDDVADFLECYAKLNHLHVWLNTEFGPDPKYDTQTDEWVTTVVKDGKPLTVRTKHIYFACGYLGKPKLPTFDGQDTFKGEIYHSLQHNARDWTGKKVTVVGAGNTAADIAQDISTRGGEVTIVQRTPSVVTSYESIKAELFDRFPTGMDVHDADLRLESMPLRLLFEESDLRLAETNARDKELREKLMAVGFKHVPGPNNAGQLGIVFMHHGANSWLDVGCGQYIIDGKIKMKGSGVAGFYDTGMKFEDGSKLDTDTAVLCTGYYDVDLKDIVGDKLAPHLSQIWGLDEFGEINGIFRPSGGKGIWLASGDFQKARTGSRRTALQIIMQEQGFRPKVGAYV